MFVRLYVILYIYYRCKCPNSEERTTKISSLTKISSAPCTNNQGKFGNNFQALLIHENTFWRAFTYSMTVLHTLVLRTPVLIFSKSRKYKTSPTCPAGRLGTRHPDTACFTTQNKSPLTFLCSSGLQNMLDTKYLQTSVFIVKYSRQKICSRESFRASLDIVSILDIRKFW